jgi:hypothetical protein
MFLSVSARTSEETPGGDRSLVASNHVEINGAVFSFKDLIADNSYL